MDWTYRVPKLRDWVTFYGDAFADDQISPIAYWDRSAIRGGSFSPTFRASQDLICALKASTPICRREERSAMAFSTAITGTSMATPTRANCWQAGSGEKGRVHRAGQTIGSALAIGCSSTTGTRK